MTAIRIDGNVLAAKVRDRIAAEVSALKARGVTPGLAVVLVGEDAASQVYVRNKVAACAKVGMHSVMHKLPAATTEAELLALIDSLNRDATIHGILVQLPLPKHIAEKKVLEAVAAHKDVDGFHAENVGALMIGEPRFVSCTPAGCMEMLRDIGMTDLRGKHAVVVGRSNIVGKPMAMLLLHANATVTICHSGTKDLAAQCRQADILVAAVGRPRFIKADMVKPGAVVIDVGINRLPESEGGKLVGDVDFDAVNEVAGYLTPVPGGVGPMTITMLLQNTLVAANRA
ncbi:bifunctional methylenetetrahydrofolate dehydrogenase/methenyltetrahydrofolate cyclohydrolase FolD [Casimicrobium huifangae]|jgi:methylenetetrahydrofolate dehydrogenase (NADP+)/methenyltetrahydrofolate cyclohydrolase|uniref:bifunctional methylenetetrahydrofolate dehydrogenase/methenyltetrahydrofolate cyclohydrolase FolD n=1 Tax=Casimicrobium huifangae TaxID=2591109 RepID=UPI0012EB7A3C|nr:bifunctional methylenetetrahydrofolate dehydrogenase/methenyltetrahydrofolate cyclohydrolase FolD [Casimicrobium huifangae]HOB00036.1 bifunctional methylenetetrahydrofolate dehydrogenase/methenyltetrahydrofolate cyclohydrolase FolD [Casimicrobium huifangae]HQA32845.1 bifunctional methylenetetrahydrofolate dehydrogenase/methenyltetrahydrofolate cyclohydrolase FolD [Casimicrobium huifangae]